MSVWAPGAPGAALCVPQPVVGMPLKASAGGTLLSILPQCAVIASCKTYSSKDCGCTACNQFFNVTAQGACEARGGGKGRQPPAGHLKGSTGTSDAGHAV